MADARANVAEDQKNAIAARGPLFGRWALVSLFLLGLLVALGFLIALRTDDAMSEVPSLRRNGGAAAGQRKAIVDESPWATARSLTGLAVTQEELAYARDAEHLADHDVDQAFAAALRTASLQQKTLTGAALEQKHRIDELESNVAADQAAVKELTAKGGDELDIAQAQLGLDQDELDDARADLARASGDQRSEIQQQLTAREADMKKFDSAQGLGEVAAVSVRRYSTLAGLIGGWQRQNSRYALLLDAKAAALQDAAKFSAEHDKLENALKAGGAATTATTGARVADLKRLGLERQLLSIYDDRSDTEQRLADVYARWAVQVQLQHRIVQHLILIKAMWIAGILIFAIVLNAFVRRFTERERLDFRKMRTLSNIVRLVIQVLTLISILLVIFGPPSQVSTVIGLTTAGLTVALQDFILAFIGWFMLMGRSGLGVGDSVEINGVAGEVVEIGLFRTTLLETGNWTAKGHPTGRRVAFNNKYAISGTFFKFSTAGQWMWDELTISIPQNEESDATIERVQAAAVAAVQEDSEKAEREWRQASNLHSLAHFSAEPAVNLRPSSSGLDLVIRYVTQAGGRFEKRDKVYQCVLSAIHAPKAPAAKG
ncbi:MAG TPA: mechanosensitive ion channel domain-containing protein [Acidobacteriaceae bacterium]|nr:mechanosensitive ion channel domain-containing protein [Acidobacteriaceae bacterium]